jgi:hypothetical protein
MASHIEFTQNVYIPESMLENTPSRQRGLQADQEYFFRRFGCELIQEAGILLKMYAILLSFFAIATFLHAHWGSADFFFGFYSKLERLKFLRH